jgi:hypothetical protein
MSVSLRPLLALGAFALAAGCNTVMENKTVAMIAPEWFEAKSKEVKGQGYPSLNDVPATVPPPNDKVEMQAAANRLKAEAVRLSTDPAYAVPNADDAEARAKAAQLRALAEKGGAPPQPKPPTTPTP